MALANLNTADFLVGNGVTQDGNVINIADIPLFVASGTDTYTYTGDTVGDFFRLQIPNNNTGAATFNPNGTGDKPLKKNVTEDLAANDLKAGGVYIVHDDGTNYQVIGIGGSPGGGGGTWGSITGTLSSQTDLQAALDSKLSAADLEYLYAVASLSR